MSFEKMYIVWICAAVLFGIFESLTAQLVSVWFVIGAVAALVSSLAGAEFYVQIIVFIAVSVLMLLITRPLVKKKLIVKSEPTNAVHICPSTFTCPVALILSISSVTVAVLPMHLSALVGSDLTMSFFLTNGRVIKSIKTETAIKTMICT